MIKLVGVIGAGTMGHGIAELCAVSGYSVVLVDVSSEVLEGGMRKIELSLSNLERKGFLPEPKENVMGRIMVSVSIEELADADFVIEAVKEDSEIKRKVLSNVSRTVRQDCIITTNTSTIPISDLSGSVSGEGRFLGLHFSNPPILMPILEIISGEKTTDECSARTQDFAKSLGKDHVMVLRDVPGFLINRLNDRLITEAFSMLEEGHTISQLDSMARYRLDFPMGIFELLDFVGIDTVYNAKKELESRGFETVIHERLSKIVKEGKTGFKSGGGFYDYSGSASYQGPVIVPEDGMYEASPVRLLSPVINEAAWILRNGVSSAGDIEKAMKMAMNWPKGPLEYADIFGIDNVVNTLDRRHKETGHPMYVADSLLMDMKRGGKTGILSGEGFSRWKLEKFTYGPVSMTVHDAFALVTMNRPDKLNSLDEASWSGLREAFEAASGMDGVRTVILTGSGRAFCAGDDIAMMGKWKAGEAGKWMDDYARPLVRLLADYPKPTISAVNGPAFGGGCELAMLFDIVLASERAVFSLPEGLIGAVPPIASSYGYSIINRKLARYALTGERFSARQASDLDMVDIVVSHEQLMPAAIELAERISKVAPLSSESVKKIVNSARSMFGRQEEIGSGELVRLASTRDFEEGQRAFLGKRKPAWEGR